MAGITLEEKHKRAVMRLETARMDQMVKAIESLPELIRDEDEDDWVKFSGGTKKPYTEAELVTLREQAHKLQYTCAGRNILQTLQDFIVGKDASVDAIDEDEAIQEYWDGWIEANEWDMRLKEILRRTFRDGECFIRWFDPERNGLYQQIRFVNPSEIKAGNGGKPKYGIKTDPEDIEKPLEYHRVWMRGTEQKQEDIPADQIDHIKILVDSDVKRGVSFFVGIAKYMKEYEKWLQDRIILNRIRHIWNVIGDIESASSTGDVKGMFTDVTGKTPADGTAKKRVPKPGGIFLNKGIKWRLENLNIKAADTKDDGRAIQLMIALGTNLPEYVIRGDASNANYASTMVSESPFVRAMESWQDVFEKLIKKVYKRVIEHGIAERKIPSETSKTITKYDRVTGEETETAQKGPTDTDCAVNFATLIHRNLKEDTEAYASHVVLKIASKQTVREKLGYDNDTELDQIDKEGREEDEKAYNQHKNDLSFAA